MNIFKPKKIDLTQGGLAKVLGTLEADVVEFIWDHGESTAREVCDFLNQDRDISFNAVNTVISRLVDKKVLLRTKTDSFWKYSACYDREAMYQMVAHDIFLSLIQDKKLFSAAAFLDAIDNLTDEEKRNLRDALK